MNDQNVNEMSKTVTANYDLLDAFFSAGFFVQLTVVVLLFLSVYGLGIVLKKFKELKENKKNDEKFFDFFKEASLSEWESLYTQGLTNKGQLASLFVSIYRELQETEYKSSKESIERVIYSEIDTLIFRLENGLSHLATIASSSPFIGLFGTVVGILTAFHKIGAAGNASLATVGPAISEALVVTAMGLFVAIPAVGFYNHFIHKVKETSLKLNNFACVILNCYKKSEPK